ncbi:MAG: aminotransferase class IV [Caldilineales bacterium]
MSLPHYVSHNGRLLAAAQAAISIFNPALFGAFGVYESIQQRRGVVFRLPDHLARLAASAEAIGLSLPAALPEISAWTHDVLAANNCRDALIRLLALGPSAGYPAELFIWPETPRTPAPEMAAQGVGAITFTGERALPHAKSLNTLVNRLALAAALAAGEHEGLLVNRAGCLTEGASSNLFVIQGGVLCTAPDDEVLAGVTQIEVLRLAVDLGLPVVQCALPLAELASWDEAFLTSTSRHVLPLVRVDGRIIGAGQPGPITQRLQAAFEALFEAALGSALK